MAESESSALLKKLHRSVGDTLPLVSIGARVAHVPPHTKRLVTIWLVFTCCFCCDVYLAQPSTV